LGPKHSFADGCLLNSPYFNNLYFPGYLPGQELAPSSKLKGCQRVFEPDLSPLLYKSKYAQCGSFDHGIATIYVANIGANY